MQQARRKHLMIVGLAGTLGCLALLAGPSISLPAASHPSAPTAGPEKPGAALLGQASRKLSKLRNEFPKPLVRLLALH